jgi:hypothetical protein
MPNPPDLKVLTEFVKVLDARRVRAHELLAVPSRPSLYFAILGLDLEGGEFDAGDGFSIRGVTNPPGEVELAAALEEPHLLSAVGRYSHAISHEFCVPLSFGESDDPDLNRNDPTLAMNVGWTFISLLRVKAMSDFLVPLVSTCSWSTFAGVPEHSARVSLLEDVPKARRFGATRQISKADVTWSIDNFRACDQLLHSERFKLAVDCLTTHQHESSLRMTVASLWAGIESLHNVSAELRFRLSLQSAYFLERNGEGRLARYRTVKKLYDFRSKAVHGHSLDDALLEEHIHAVRNLLSDLICKVLVDKVLPNESQWESILFAD